MRDGELRQGIAIRYPDRLLVAPTAITHLDQVRANDRVRRLAAFLGDSDQGWAIQPTLRPLALAAGGMFGPFWAWVRELNLCRHLSAVVFW